MIRKQLKSAPIKRQLIGSAMLIAFVTAIIMSSAAYLMSKRAVVNATGNKALQVADSIAASIDGETFLKIASEGMDSPTYQTVHTQFNQLMNQTGIKYLYTMQQNANGDYIYVLDGSPMDSEDFCALGDVEEEISRHHLSAFAGKPSFGFISDHWGQLISAYSPILDASGQVVGIVGVDFDASNLARQLNNIQLSILTVFVAMLVLTFLVQNRFSKEIVDPILQLTDVAVRMAEGDMNVSLSTDATHEIGQCMNAFAKMVENMREQIGLTQAIAEGDLTSKVQIRSENDALNISVAKMSEKIQYLVGRISAISHQVAVKSNLLLDSSSAIAQGATEQASAIQELNASVEEISAETARNARRAKQSAEATDAARTFAEEGNVQMAEMLSCMRAISESSRNIEHIIKTINNIAFQTNILALNASVEASRAGAAGRGFAVVAEEVRSLAVQSAAAAKDTTEIIGRSIKQAEEGMKIADTTAMSLLQITTKIDEAADIANTIAASSQQQAMAIEQIRAGLSQVSSVIQANAASTEESAATSTELAEQARHLEEAVRVFKIKA